MRILIFNSHYTPWILFSIIWNFVHTLNWMSTASDLLLYHHHQQIKMTLWIFLRIIWLKMTSCMRLMSHDNIYTFSHIKNQWVFCRFLITWIWMRTDSSSHLFLLWIYWSSLFCQNKRILLYILLMLWIERKKNQLKGFWKLNHL